MAVVMCYECERHIDLDYDVEVEYVDGEFYHWQCAIDLELIEEEETYTRDEQRKHEEKLDSTVGLRR